MQREAYNLGVIIGYKTAHLVHDAVLVRRALHAWLLTTPIQRHWRI